jgi:flagellar assembly factor FliW
LLIDTKYFGKLEIGADQIIFFPKGIPAFESVKEYVLLTFPDNDIYYCLQSIKEPEVAFIVVNPWDFFPGYDFEIIIGYFD